MIGLMLRTSGGGRVYSAADALLATLCHYFHFAVEGTEVLEMTEYSQDSKPDFSTEIPMLFPLLLPVS